MWSPKRPAVDLAVILLALVVLLTLIPRNGGATEEPPEPAAESQTTARDRPVAPASGEYVKERGAMVTRTIERPWDGRTRVKSKAVIQAMRAVPRHAFIPSHRFR